jgi:hypothetical protein
LITGGLDFTKLNSAYLPTWILQET